MFYYRRDFVTYYTAALAHIVPAIVLAKTIDKLSCTLKDNLDLSPLLTLMVQGTINVFVLFLIEDYVSRQYASQWQTTTPGIFFTVLFFGLQDNFIRTIALLNQQ